MARPPFKPTAEQRKMIELLAGTFVPQSVLADTVGLRSTKSLRKHFSKALNAGYAKGIDLVAKTCWEMAQSGKFPQVTEFWVRTMGSAGFAGDTQDITLIQRFYYDEPPEDTDEEYKLTKSGEYMIERVIRPLKPRRMAKPARRKPAMVIDNLQDGGARDAEPEA